MRPWLTKPTRCAPMQPPMQVLSILSWGKQNPGWTLLLYNDEDMQRYMSRCARCADMAWALWGREARIRSRRGLFACGTRW